MGTSEGREDDLQRAYADPAVRRELLNPFGESTWEEFLNELTYGYMTAERDEWQPLADVHRHWIEQFESEENIGILAHRDCLKTTFTLSYLIACLEYIDGFRAHWITNNQNSAYKKADTEFWKMVERNPWLTNLNATPVQDSKSTKEFQNGSALYAGWLFGGIEGDRSHLLILDDLIKEHGDGETENIMTWVEGVTVPMVKDSGKTAVIGTRKRPDDIYSHLIDRDAYDFTEYPAILEEWDREFGDDGNWINRRPPEELYTEAQIRGTTAKRSMCSGRKLAGLSTSPTRSRRCLRTCSGESSAWSSAAHQVTSSTRPMSTDSSKTVGVRSATDNHREKNHRSRVRRQSLLTTRRRHPRATTQRSLRGS